MNNAPLTQKQYQAMIALGDGVSYLLYGGAGGGGKSWLGCSWLILVCSNCSGVRYFVGRNNLKDTRDSVVVTFTKVANALGFDHYKLNDDGIHFSNGAEIVFLDLSFYPKKDPMFERLGSKEYTGGWIEEAGEVHQLAFEVLKSRVGRHMNERYEIPAQILLTCNPKKGWLYKMFYKPWREGTLQPMYGFIQSLVQDNKYISQDYIKNLESIADRVTKARLLFGEWEYDDNPNALVSYDSITDLFTNDYCSDSGKQYISADVALKGRDSYVRANRRGDTIRLAIKPIMRPTEVEKDIRDSATANQVRLSDVVVDSDGVGAFVTDYLQGGYEFHGEARAYREGYANLKSDCAYMLAEKIQQGKLHVVCDMPTQERLTSELEVLIAETVDDTRKKKIISKDKMKAILGHSPDILDSLIMLMIFEVKPKTRGMMAATAS